MQSFRAGFPDSIIEQYLQTLSPLATGLKPALRPLSGIRVCLFDIYGTLLISGSGDVGSADADQKEHCLRQAFADEGLALHVPEGYPLSSVLYDLIQKEHAHGRSCGRPFPEVNILHVWRQLCEALCEQGALPSVPQEPQRQRLAFRYEMLANPVYPMPDAEALLAWLNQRQILTGIVSNAQFYTPLLLTYFFKKPVEELFPQGLFSWSYCLKRAKPDRALFDTLLALLKKNHDISAHECVYLGNDMLNDVWTAQRCGMRTVLFAGDSRSLRLRSDRDECRGLHPDGIIQKLTDFKAIVKGG